MTIYPQSLADQDWPRRMRQDRARFARELSAEMQKLAAQMQALATLADFYFTDTLQVIAAGSDETDEHRRAPLDPAPAPARPPARSSAMASRVRDVGAAPAGNAERPPQPILPETANEAAGFDSRSLAEDRCDDGSNPSAVARSGTVADRGGARRPDGGERPATSIPQSDGAPPPRAVPAGPPTVDRPRVQSEDMPIALPVQSSARLIKKDTPKPAPEREAKPVALPATFNTMGIVAIDTDSHIIRGPKGDVQVNAPTARTLARINAEGLFPISVMLDAGPWPGESSFRTHLTSIRAKLETIGAELVEVRGAGFRLRLAEAS